MKWTKRGGFSLAELSLVCLVILVLSSGVSVCSDWLADSARRTATLQEMDTLQNAIILYSQHRRDGALPSNLGVLRFKLSAADSRDGLEKGVYIKKANWTAEESTWVDAWGNPYQYSPGSRTLISSGGGTQLIIRF